jgi:hypothetical protein
VLAGPVWEAARNDPSSLELYPTSIELSVPGLSPSMLLFTRTLGYQDPPQTPVDDDAEAAVDTSQTFYPEGADPRP